MDAIVSFFGFLQSLGVSVMMPIVITIIGCALGAGFGKSLKAGLLVGVGFIGLNLVINQLFGSSLGPAVQEMIKRFGLQLSVMDVGWPAGAAIALGTAVGLVIIPLGLVVNILLVLINFTQTVNVDIWNYWHFAFVGSLVANVTGNLTLGFAAAIIDEIILLVLADATAKDVQKALNMPGVSISQGFSLAYAPVAWAINWVLDRIPGVRDIDIDIEKMQKKFGVFGEPLFIGTIIGIIIGFVAYFDGSDVAGSITQVLTLGVSLGAVLVLIPRMASLLMEGLMPISDAASNFIQTRVKNRGNIYIGLDSAIAVGYPATLSLALILIPLMVAFALILQPLGNQTLPFVDLTAGTYLLAVAVPICKGNGFRGLIVGLVSVVGLLLISTALAPLITQSAMQAGFDIAGAVGDTGVAGSSLVTVLSDGGSPLSGVFVLLSSINPIVGVVVTGVVAVAMGLWNRQRIMKEAAELHAGTSEQA